MKFVLIYNIIDFHDMRGGIHAHFFDSEDELHTAANTILTEEGKRVDIIAAGQFKRQFEYKPSVIVTKYTPTEL